jgi:hypothetical protein
MDKIKLVKNGKFYNPETSELIAVSSWYVYREIKRHKIYKTAKGAFFKVTEKAVSNSQPECHVVLNNGTTTTYGAVIGMGIREGMGTFRDDVAIEEVRLDDVLTEVDVMKIFEHTAKGGTYAPWHYARMGYSFTKSYEELFSIEEA